MHALKTRAIVCADFPMALPPRWVLRNIVIERFIIVFNPFGGPRGNRHWKELVFVLTAGLDRLVVCHDESSDLFHRIPTKKGMPARNPIYLCGRITTPYADLFASFWPVLLYSHYSLQIFSYATSLDSCCVLCVLRVLFKHCASNSIRDECSPITCPE